MMIKKEIKIKNNLKDFLETMKPLDSFNGVNANEYIQKLREKSRLRS